MSNTMYLVCVHHPEPVLSLRLASRTLVRDRSGDMEPYTVYKRTQENMERFFEAHKLCGGGFDHFTIAYEQTKDYDLPTPAPLADAVHLSLRDAANES